MNECCRRTAKEVAEAIELEAVELEGKYQDNPIAFDNAAGMRKAAKLARSFISKPEPARYAHWIQPEGSDIREGHWEPVKPS